MDFVVKDSSQIFRQTEGCDFMHVFSASSIVSLEMESAGINL